MNCPHEQAAKVYARFSDEAVSLVEKLYDDYTKLAASQAVIPSPYLEPVIRSFMALYLNTRCAYPVEVPHSDDEFA